MVWWVKNEMVKVPLNTVTDDMIQYDVPDFMCFMFKTHLQLKHQRNYFQQLRRQTPAFLFLLLLVTANSPETAENLQLRFFTVKSLKENHSHKNISVKILRFSQTVERKTNSSGCRGLDICLSSKRSLALFQQETQMPSRLSQESLLTQTWSVLSLHSLKRPAGADSSSCKQSASREEKFSYHWNAK